MNSRAGRWSAALLLGVLMSLLCALPCFAAGGVSQINLHIGQTPDTVYLTYSAPDAAQGAVSVTGPEGMSAYTATPVWSDSAGKYLYSAKLDGLVPGSSYTYEIAGAYSGAFQSPADSGAFTFAFLADPQIGFASDAKATGALFSLLNKRDDLAFTYIAGNLTDSSRNERQWELSFQSGGVNSSAGQSFLGSHLLAVAQGNHDNSSFSGHITAPSAGRDVGPAVYSFDYSSVKFVVLNMNSPDTWVAQADFLRRGDAARGDLAATSDQAPDEVPSAGYADVPENAWYAGAVNTVSARGLMDVRSESHFAPGESLTRAELVTALYRLAGMPAANAGTAFPDVPRSSGCYDAVSWAAGAGLVSGMPDGRFAPESGITRAQLATILYRYAVHSGTSVATGSGIGTYADWRQVGPWCREPISWAVETGLICGKPGNRLAPNDVVTRAEGAVFLQRLL